MINLLMGAPGGGKSYEAVVFHILAALSKGRKVITNLALHLDAFASIEPGYVDLIERRFATLAAKGAPGGKPRNNAAFSQVEDYGDKWRHPVNGGGPLYVIDECHIALPKVGTPVAVEEWYSLHRHEFADVLLISQSYGKLNVAIKDLLQIVYRVRKNVAFGSAKSYTRKVQDGVRGEVVNTAVRRYEEKYFSLYQSHTRSAAGVEMGAADIVPFWRHWTFYGMGACVVLFVAVVAVRGNPLAMFAPKPQPKLLGESVPEARPEPQGFKTKDIPGVAALSEVPAAVAASGWPYGALELHVGGFARMAAKTVMLIVFSQNGQRVFEQTSTDLEAAGYRVTVLNDCLVRLEFGKLAQNISCDSPRVGLALPVRSNQARPVEAVERPLPTLPSGKRSS